MTEGSSIYQKYNNRPINTDSLLQEIGFVVSEAAAEGRTELNAKEIEFVTRISKGFVTECKLQLGVVPHLLPEQFSEETVNQILEKIER